MIVVPAIALSGGGPRVAVEVSAKGPLKTVFSGQPESAAGAALDRATLPGPAQAASEAPDVSVVAAGEVAPSPANAVLATVHAARYTPLGSTAAIGERDGPAVTVTTTPRRRVTPTPVTPPRTARGEASWYQAAPGTCAHPTLPFGTVVTIVDLANGHTATCTVDDRGPYQGGRIIDLSYDVFEELAPVGLGVIPVRLSW